MRPQADHPVALERELALHVVVAGEAGRDQVAGAILDPLDRPADQQRRGRGDDVARVDRDLVAEAAADVRRHDPDLVLGQPGDDGEQRAMHVRRLGGHVDRGLAGRRVDVRDAAAALERRGVGARVERLEGDDPVGVRERLVCRLLVARLPVVDGIALLPFLLVADDGGVGRQGLLRARDGRERLVVDVDQLEGVLGDVRALRDHGGHFLALEAHLVRREHGLGVAGERRHPRQVVLGHELAGHDGHDPGQGRGSRRVDRVDTRVGEGATQQLEVEHPRQHDVVDVVAPAPDEARVLLASARSSRDP